MQSLKDRDFLGLKDFTLAELKGLPALAVEMKGGCDWTRSRWQKGDILLPDNMLAAHGRASFSGLRQVLVGMAQPGTRDQV